MIQKRENDTIPDYRGNFSENLKNRLFRRKFISVFAGREMIRILKWSAFGNNTRAADMTRERKPNVIIFARRAINILGNSRRTSALNESLTKAKYINDTNRLFVLLVIHFSNLSNTKFILSLKLIVNYINDSFLFIVIGILSNHFNYLVISLNNGRCRLYYMLLLFKRIKILY